MIVSTPPRDIATITAIDHDEATILAETETQRVLELAAALSPPQWQAPTECPGWTVKDTLAHLLGMWKAQADRDELNRQQGAAIAASQASGRLRIDELTALQVAEHAQLDAQELLRQLRGVASRALAARAALPAALREQPYDPQFPGESAWTLGYLLDVISTRDPWMHRVDICRAIAHPMILTADHDGRLIADVVAEWGRRHGQPFVLALSGQAGGNFSAGTDGAELNLDAVEFCRILSGRSEGAGLLTTRVPF